MVLPRLQENTRQEMIIERLSSSRAGSSLVDMSRSPIQYDKAR